MIPVTQTKVCVYNSKGNMIVSGNCFAAAIASILELPITEVPNFETLFDVGDNYYYEVLHKFLHSRGYRIMDAPWFKIFHEMESAPECIKQPLEDDYYLVSGKSPRDIMHICIFKNGKMVHDPHPAKEGLVTFEFFEQIVKIGYSE